jgi:hypothetical protein
MADSAGANGKPASGLNIKVKRKSAVMMAAGI